MTKGTRRNHLAAFKAKVAIAAIKGDRTLAQIAEQFDVHPNQVTIWKAQLEGGASEVFGDSGGSAPAVPAIRRTSDADFSPSANDRAIEPGPRIPHRTMSIAPSVTVCFLDRIYRINKMEMPGLDPVNPEKHVNPV